MGNVQEWYKERTYYNNKKVRNNDFINEAQNEYFIY